MIRNKVPAYILAGGKSSRFGSDKARAVVNNKLLLQHVVEDILPVVTQITVVADIKNKYKDLGLRTIIDRIPHLGPMGGLVTAMKDCQQSKWLLLVPCDWVEIPAIWLNELFSISRKNIEVIAFRKDKWEPFPALYNVSLLETLEESLKKGERSLWRVLSEANHKSLMRPKDFQNKGRVNTLDDLKEVQKCYSTNHPG